MNTYPGQITRAIKTGVFHIGRKVFQAARHPEESHLHALKMGQMMEDIPGLISTILGDKKFDNWMLIQGQTWRIGNLNLSSPFVTAGGMLKHHDLIPYEALKRLPIGAATIGGITREPREGNPRPRLFVDEASESIVNRMGLNNSGAEMWAAQLAYDQDVSGQRSLPLIANIANDPDTLLSKRPDEGKYITKKIGPFVKAFDYNGSCPNVGAGNGKAAFEDESLESLTDTLNSMREGLREVERGRTPILLKLPPHLNRTTIERVIYATHELVTGYTCVNTSPDPTLKQLTPIGTNKGGLSGAILLSEMFRTVKLVREIAPDATIVALGGLGTGKNRKERFETGRLAAEVGADFVSAYSSLALQGPWVTHDIIAGFITGRAEIQKKKTRF